MLTASELHFTRLEYVDDVHRYLTLQHCMQFDLVKTFKIMN